MYACRFCFGIILVRCILLQDTNIMITIVTVWLCLITHVACDVVITVNNNGNDNDNCCVNGTCPCSSLSSALHNVSDNTVINITSESVTLHDIVGMGLGNLNNVTITSNGATIMCNNTGGVYCKSCSDITIMGITWYQCGRNDLSHQIPVLDFDNVSLLLLIQDCTFLNSFGCPVSIENATGNILIKGSKFVANVFNTANQSDNDFVCAGLYVASKVQMNLTIYDSSFNDNGCIQNASGNICRHCSAFIDNYYFTFSKYNYYFLFENTSFSNNSNGLCIQTMVNNAMIQLFDVNVYSNTRHGIYIALDGDLDSTSNIRISSATFVNNAYALVIHADENLECLSININNSTFNNTSNDIPQSGIEIDSFAIFTIDVSNSIFYNNQNGAVSITTISNDFLCSMAKIVLINVIVQSTTNNTSNRVYIHNEDVPSVVILEKVNFTSNYIMRHTVTLLVENYFTSMDCQLVTNYPVFIQLTDCTFDNNTAPDYVVMFAYVLTYGYQDYFDIFNASIKLSDCKFVRNVGGKSIVYINVPTTEVSNTPNISLILDNSTFSNNNNTALHLFLPEVQFKEDIRFVNNSAINGAAIYLEEVHTVSSDDNANVQFINNFAEQNGGAMYINIVTDYGYVFKNISNPYAISFTNNFARITGSCIYFSIHRTCHTLDSLLNYPNRFKYNQSKSVYPINPPILTSPYNVTLYPPAIATQNSSKNYLIQGSKMLGEPIQINASVFDYFNNITDPVTFSIDCKTCGDDYVLSTYQISVHNQSIYELKIFPTVSNDVVNNTQISIRFLSALPPIYKPISASLSVQLSHCRVGYFFSNTQKHCCCYSYNDLVHCKEDYSYVEIKIGYWIGFLTEQHYVYTSSICPDNYCSSEHTESSPGYYSLHGESDDQCNSHRTGVACGECKSGYTLAYDTPDCINKDNNCSDWMTILVIVLTILYWIAIVAVVFGLMYFQFQISSGYAYGIIYFYSIVDILLVNDVSKEIFYLVGVLSSFAKLNPQLFGKLCFVKGLSGIDQQFIHYSHALAVSLILLIIVLVTKYFPRVAVFVRRCIIRVICLILLLSYTSLASTSLQLLRPLRFNDVDEWRTYSSPDIKYFTGRHLVYAIVAILCEVIIVIALPLFLLLEPFLRRKVNLVRIKPLLDQFQGCYKDKYRWFAAYYLICRQVIILIVYVGNGNYYYMLYGLQTACVIIAMIHIWLQPYKNNLLNGLDGVVLLVLVLIVNLNIFSLLSFIPAKYFSFVLVVFPLLLLCFIAIFKLLNVLFCNKKERLLRLYNPVKACEESDSCINERR